MWRSEHFLGCSLGIAFFFFLVTVFYFETESHCIALTASASRGLGLKVCATTAGFNQTLYVQLKVKYTYKGSPEAVFVKVVDRIVDINGRTQECRF